MTFPYIIEATLNPPTFNTMKGRCVGKRIYKFNDGTEIEYHNPFIQVDGILMGDRVLHYTTAGKIICKKSKLVGEIKYCHNN